MNWKAVAIGAVVFWLVTNVVALFGTGLIIHEKILDPIYQANESFWLPELRQDPLHELFERVTIVRKEGVDVPRYFSDFRVSVDGSVDGVALIDKL